MLVETLTISILYARVMPPFQFFYFQQEYVVILDIIQVLIDTELSYDMSPFFVRCVLGRWVGVFSTIFSWHKNIDI